MSAPVHPLVARAADGRLPPWSRAAPARLAHMERVAELLEEWAGSRELEEDEVFSWRAAGMLHDALRDEEPERLRPLVPRALQDLPDPLLHGPAVAARLEEAGVEDRPLLQALTFHSTGHPDLDALGRHLYLADFLEPGRSFRPRRRRELRERMPDQAEGVLREVARERISWLLHERLPVRREAVAFWNALVEGGNG